MLQQFLCGRPFRWLILKRRENEIPNRLKILLGEKWLLVLIVICLSQPFWQICDIQFGWIFAQTVSKKLHDAREKILTDLLEVHHLTVPLLRWWPK